MTQLLPCPFCGSTDVDPKGWASTDRSGPACDDCAGTADTVELWNKRPCLNALIEECAQAAEQQDRTGYEWVRDSLWANILRRAGANVRKLKGASSQVSSQHGGRP